MTTFLTNNAIDLPKVDMPGLPEGDRWKLYFGTDNFLYAVDSAGNTIKFALAENSMPLIDPAVEGNLVTQTAEGGLVDAGFPSTPVGDYVAALAGAAVGKIHTVDEAGAPVFVDPFWEVDATEIVPDEIASGTSPLWENESSTFTGWGTNMGAIPEAASVKIYVRSWDSGNLISRVRLRIRAGDHTGTVVYDDEVAITPTHNVVQECNFVFGGSIGDGATVHWIEFYTNGRCGMRRGLAPIYATTDRGYVTSLTAIDDTNPSMANIAASATMIYYLLQPVSIFEPQISPLLQAYVRSQAADTDRLNLSTLRRFWRKAAEIDYGDNEIARIAVIGDSWVNSNYRITTPLRLRLAAAHGDAGYGWVGASTGEAVPSALVTRTYGGSWTHVDAGAGGIGPSLHHAVSAATGATLTFAATSVTGWKIHYRSQAGGGDFRWRVASGSWNNVDTDAAAAAHVIDAPGAGSLEIEVLAQDTAGVLLLGAEAYLANKGVLIHKLGNSGATVLRWLDADAAKWQEVIGNLAIDTAVICLGTNDMSVNVAPSLYTERMAALAARVRATDPTIDILFLSPSDNGLTDKTYTMRQYSDALASYAQENGEAWLDLWRLFGEYEDANGDTLIDRNMYEDSVHPNFRGGRAIGRLLAGAFE